MVTYGKFDYDVYHQSPVSKWVQRLTAGAVGVRTTIIYPAGSRYLDLTAEGSIVDESRKPPVRPLYPATRGRKGTRIRMKPFLVSCRNPTP